MQNNKELKTNLFQSKILSFLCIIIIIIILNIISTNNNCSLLELINNILNQTLLLDSTEKWNNPSNPSNIMILDNLFIDIIEVPTEFELIRIFPSDLLKIEVKYLDPLWLEYVSQYFNTHSNDVLLQRAENQIEGVIYDYYNRINSSKSSQMKYILHDNLYKKWQFLKTDDYGAYFHHKASFIEMYKDSVLLNWELLNIQNGKSLKLLDIWPNEGINLPFINDLHHFDRILYQENLNPNKDCGSVSKQYYYYKYNVRELKTPWNYKLLNIINKFSNKLSINVDTIEKYKDVINSYSNIIQEKLRLKSKSDILLSECCSNCNCTTVSCYK